MVRICSKAAQLPHFRHTHSNTHINVNTPGLTRENQICSPNQSHRCFTSSYFTSNVPCQQPLITTYQNSPFFPHYIDILCLVLHFFAFHSCIFLHIEAKTHKQQKKLRLTSLPYSLIPVVWTGTTLSPR